MRNRLVLLAVALAVHLPAPGWSQQGGGVSMRVLAAAKAARAVVADTTTLCSVVIDGSSGSTVDVRFRGMPGNQAATNRNHVAIWQNSVIPWPVEPLSRTQVVVDGEEGSLVLLNLSITRVTYTVGYAVGPRSADTCASAQLSLDGSPGSTDAVSLGITAVSSNSLTLHYHTLAGYLPQTSGNWIGLWKGRASPYNPPPLVARVSIPADVTDDDVRMDGIVLSVNTPYTLVYFMGPEMSTAAVMINFVALAPSSPARAPAAVAALGKRPCKADRPRPSAVRPNSSPTLDLLLRSCAGPSPRHPLLRLAIDVGGRSDRDPGAAKPARSTRLRHQIAAREPAPRKADVPALSKITSFNGHSERISSIASRRSRRRYESEGRANYLLRWARGIINEVPTPEDATTPLNEAAGGGRGQVAADSVHRRGVAVIRSVTASDNDAVPRAGSGCGVGSGRHVAAGGYSDEDGGGRAEAKKRSYP